MENEIVLHQHFLFDVLGSLSLPNELQGIRETTTKMMSTKMVVDDVASKVQAIWKLIFFFLLLQTDANGHHTITTMLYGLFLN
jgi:hypothetical protein